MSTLPLKRDLDRSSIVNIVSYELLVDLTGEAGMFRSRAEIRFCGLPGNVAYADVYAASIGHAELNGAPLDLDRAYQPGRLELPQLAGDNTLIVEAKFGYVSAGAGLHRQAGPDGQVCVYSKAYPGGAPRIYCCFDEPQLRAPYTVSVQAPAGWSCLANGPVTARPAAGEAGRWTFEATRPIAPYLFSLCAGPLSGPAFTWEPGQRWAVPVSAAALPSATAALQAAVSPGLFSSPLAYYERHLGMPYPYGKCDVAFVPGWPGLAFGAPGLVTVKDQALTQPHEGSPGLYLAIVIAHEVAHAWFGGLIDLRGPDGDWLIEALTTYISRTAIEQTRPGTTPWAEPVSKVLPDHGYARNAATVRQVEHLIGRPAMLAGLRELLHRHAHGCAAKDDLVRYWSRAAGRNLRAWAADTLIPAAADDTEDEP